MISRKLMVPALYTSRPPILCDTSLSASVATMSAPASHEDRTAAGGYGPWHPGLESELPRELLPLATVFRRENVSTSVAEAFELSDYCGLPPQELVAFRPERLIIHELLVRLTAGLAVPDGNDYEDLGRNFREIASTILTKDIAPHLNDLKHVFEEVRSAASVVIAQELSNLFSLRLKPAADADQTSRASGRPAVSSPLAFAEIARAGSVQVRAGRPACAPFDRCRCISVPGVANHRVGTYHLIVYKD